ncbi:MAG: hypothetical protein V7752_12380 [Halopseudomonas sp.]
MLTKILFTALVIIACLLFIRYKASRTRTEKRVVEVPAQLKGPLKSPVRMLALGLCLVSVLASAAFLGIRWMDDKVLLQVRVINAASGEQTEYQAYKGDVEGRSFITIYGQQVSIADSERMEISEAVAR